MNQTDTTPAPSNREEVQELTALLNQKPEINNKVEYYKAILKTNDTLIKSIEDKLGYGKEVKSVRLLYIIPVTITRTISDYERAKLLAEKIEIENQMYYQKKYFEDWMQRRNEYEVYFDKLSAECNERFEELYAQAVELSKHNTRISGVIGRYNKDGNNQEKKNALYLFLRQEVKAKRVPELSK